MPGARDLCPEEDVPAEYRGDIALNAEEAPKVSGRSARPRKISRESERAGLHRFPTRGSRGFCQERKICASLRATRCARKAVDFGNLPFGSRRRRIEKRSFVRQAIGMKIISAVAPRTYSQRLCKAFPPISKNKREREASIAIVVPHRSGNENQTAAKW